MNKLNFIEKWGTGINRILSSCEAKGLKRPEIIEKNDFFEIKLFRPEVVASANNNQNTESSRSITDEGGRLRTKADERGRTRTITNDYERLGTITNDYERLSEEKQTILLYLLDNSNVSRQKAIELLGLKKTRIHEILAEMVDEGLLIIKGKGKNTHYILNLENTL
jgi:predicted HTH transcriptional regulator